MEALTTIEYANNYFKTKPGCKDWEKLDDIAKETWLMEATRHIYALQGFKYTPEIVELLTVVPDDLQQACCEVTNTIIKTGTDNVHVLNQQLGITSISFGKDSASYKSSSSFGVFNSVIFSDYAQSILNKYLLKGVPYV